MQWLYDWFYALYERTGINYTIFYDSFDRARFLEGIVNTLWLCVVSLIGSVIIGIIGAWLQGSRFVWTRRIVQGYIQLFRNTPPLVQMYFFFFAVSALLPPVESEFGFAEPMFDNFTWAVISLSFFAGAFNVEIFRSGIEAISNSTVEAAQALGFTRWQNYVYIILPLALRVCLPSLTNNLVNLVKTTSLAYAIGVSELLYISSQIWSDNLNSGEMMLVLFVMYMLLVGVLVWLMHRWERAMKLPGFGG